MKIFQLETELPDMASADELTEVELSEENKNTILKWIHFFFFQIMLE